MPIASRTAAPEYSARSNPRTIGPASMVTPTAIGTRPIIRTRTRPSSEVRLARDESRHDRARPGRTTCWKIRVKVSTAIVSRCGAL